jgi:hypothetical protein
MIKTGEDIRSILNLRTNESIGLELANRQLEVIRKGYEYLCCPDNNVIYIADEVGLGKTYIAAGIAVLFRHFSKNPTTHKDLIIVPKKNLQEKWKKELNNFVKVNYLGDDNHIKQLYNLNDVIKHKIVPVKEEDALTIFRMTSFSSIGATQNLKSALFNHLINEVFGNDLLAEETITAAWNLGYFNKGSENLLRKLIAYLMNALSPSIDCLIIDEAHNYKYGLGFNDYEESIRNETTSRYLGAINERSFLENFPEMRKRIKFPLAKKIICLSATPKDRNLLEIKNQLCCFTNKHILSEVKTNADIEILLKKFLVRGNLEYNLAGEFISRNQCREEHRKGNVNKSITPIPLVVEDSFESIFWQLLQYKSIKHLYQKNNASFEIGMLAGFESYKVDMERKASPIQLEAEDEFVSQKEYEQTVSRTIKESQDANVIRSMIQSYYETFSEHPPHPKQSKLEIEVINQLQQQEKSLIFVRRVASVFEMENRMMEKYEREIVINQQLKLTGKLSKFKTNSVTELINSYNERKTLEALPDILKQLLNKDEIKDFILSHKGMDANNYDREGLLWLKIAFNRSENIEFKNGLSDFINRSLQKMSKEFKFLAITALSKSYRDYQDQTSKSDISDSDNDEDFSGYYFLDYFKKGRPGFHYRQKMYRENWFEINPVILNNHFQFINYSKDGLNKILGAIPITDKKFQNFKNAFECAIQYFLEEGSTNSSTFSKNINVTGILNENTFLTRLLCEHCNDEMRTWFKNRTKASQFDMVQDIRILTTLLRNIFRNGSGLLPGFVADSRESLFDNSFIELLSNIESPFYFLLSEVKSIIKDYDLIIAVNFQEKDENRVNTVLRNLAPIVGTSGQHDRDRGILAAQFRMPGFPYVLITTDIFREGEDLHTYCQNIHHYGIAWNPSDMEQRTGRIDRINSLSYRKLNQTQKSDFENKVHVFYPYLRHSVEVNQVVKLLTNLNKFIETFNDINLERYYESKININEDMTLDQIPPPITHRLKSIYDIEDFNIN